MANSPNERKLILDVTKEFHSREINDISVELNRALCDELFIPLSENKRTEVNFLGINFLRIVGTFSSVYAFNFYPEILAGRSFWKQPDVKEYLNQNGIALDEEPWHYLDSLQEEQAFINWALATARSYPVYNWNTIGDSQADYFFFMAYSSKLRRIWDVLRAVSDSGSKVAFFGTSANNMKGYERFPALNNFSSLRTIMREDAVRFLANVYYRWPELKKEIEVGIANILKRYSAIPRESSLLQFTNHFLRNLISSVVFASCVYPLLQEIGPEAVVVNNSSAPLDNALVHLAGNLGMTSYEIADAATADTPLKAYYPDLKTNPVDHLIGGGGIVDFFKSRKFPKERLAIIGTPHYDEIVIKQPNKETLLNASPADGLDLLVILPPGQPHLGGYSFASSAMLQETLKACAGTNVRIHLKMKFSDNDSLMAEVSELVEKNQIVICPSNLYVIELLEHEHYDAALSYTSLGMMEAVLMGVPVLWVEDSTLLPNGCIDYAAYTTPTTFENMARDLKIFMEDSRLRWQSLEQGQKYIEEMEIFMNRGHCAQIVADYITDKSTRINRPASPKPTHQADAECQADDMAHFLSLYFSDGQSGDKQKFWRVLERAEEKIISQAQNNPAVYQGFLRQYVLLKCAILKKTNLHADGVTFLGRVQDAVPTAEIAHEFAYNIASYYETFNQPQKAMEVFIELESRLKTDSRLSALVAYRIAHLTLSRLPLIS